MVAVELNGGLKPEREQESAKQSIMRVNDAEKTKTFTVPGEQTLTMGTVTVVSLVLHFLSMGLHLVHAVQRGH